MTTESEKAPQAGVYHMEYVGADTVRLTPVASLTADAAGAAGEYVLVPREPTEAMLEALLANVPGQWDTGRVFREGDAVNAIRNLLAASPTPPASDPTPALTEDEREILRQTEAKVSTEAVNVTMNRARLATLCAALRRRAGK